MERKTKKIIENIEKDKNKSLLETLYERNKNSLNAIAIYYRANQISYGQMFESVNNFASSLKGFGYQVGDEVLIAASNIPEFTYLLLAISKLGLKAHIIDSSIGDELIESAIDGHKNIFITDDKYFELKSKIEQSSLENLIVFSLNDSLLTIDNQKVDPYDILDRKFKSFENKVSVIRDVSRKNVIDRDAFIIIGERMEYPLQKIKKDTVLHMPFTTTYTTNIRGRVKKLDNTSDSYITLLTFRETEATEYSKKRSKVLFEDPLHTRFAIDNILETLYQGGIIICEPILDRDFLVYSIIMSRAMQVIAPGDYFTDMAKTLVNDHNFKSITIPYLRVPIITSKVSPCEIEFLDEVFKERRIGKNPLLGLRNTFYINVGYNETGRIFFGNINKNNKLEFSSLSIANIDFIDRYGQSVYIKLFGELEVDSRTNSTSFTPIRLPEYGTINENESYTLKGDSAAKIKIESGRTYPLFTIKDEIEKDNVNILSCEVVSKSDSNAILAYIVPSPILNLNENDLISSVYERIKIMFPKEILMRLEFVVINSFPLNNMGERDFKTLKDETDSVTTVSYDKTKKDKILELTPINK